MPILDQFGKPIKRALLGKEVAQAQSTGVRQSIYTQISAGMTPGALAQVLKGAVDGDIDNYLTLAEEMEERYLHYFGVLTARKLGVSGAPIKVTPFDDSARAVEIAETFEKEVVKQDNFRFMLFDLMDALGKGFSVIELVWNTKTAPWTFSKFEHRDPHWFHFDRVARRELRLKHQTNYDGEELPAGSFLVHYPHIKSGLPIRGGLARMASIAYMAQNYTLKDWLAFMEVYGMPLRIAKYDPNTIDDDARLTLRTALANLGHDAAAMLPEGMDIEIHDINRGSGGDSLFGGLANYLDKQVSKGVLGQTMTTDDGSSLAQAKEHGEVKQDYKEADAAATNATLNTGLVRPWCQLNYGENAPCCRADVDVSEPEDLEQFTKTVLPWVEKAGLRVGSRYLRDKFNVPDPDEDQEEDILGGGSAEPPPELAMQTRRGERAFDTLMVMDPAQWERKLEPHRKALQKLANNARNYEEFTQGLNGLVGEFDSDPFVKLLAEEMAKARGAGAS